eukprot:6183542-Pleurochrysis_carterae.AAC.2
MALILNEGIFERYYTVSKSGLISPPAAVRTRFRPDESALEADGGVEQTLDRHRLPRRLLRLHQPATRDTAEASQVRGAGRSEQATDAGKLTRPRTSVCSHPDKYWRHTYCTMRNAFQMLHLMGPTQSYHHAGICQRPWPHLASNILWAPDLLCFRVFSREDSCGLMIWVDLAQLLSTPLGH